MIQEYGAIETVGSITKMQQVYSIETNMLENTLVLCNSHPFPGVRNRRKTDTLDKKKNSIFIILKYPYSPEKINKVNKSFIEHSDSPAMPSFGEIITHDSRLSCIRFKGIVDLKKISQIQDFYIQNGIQLMPYRKIHANAMLKIFKSFRLIEIAEDLFRDLNEGEKIYIRINQSFTMKQFLLMTNNIKINLNKHNFDAALGNIYRFCGPIDVIRIYDEDKTLGRALQLKKLYRKEIRRLTELSSVHHF